MKTRGPSFKIKDVRPKKIATMTKVDAERHSPEAAELHKKARANVNLPSFTREEYVTERHMTSGEIKKEKKLKDKYDTSDMKASMIKQYGQEKGKKIYFATIRKQAMKEALELDEAKLPRAEKRRISQEKQKGKSKGTVHAFDVDETLFSHGVRGKPNVKVHVKDASGKRVQSLTNQEFNTHKLEPGHSYDFSEFRSSKKFGETASPNKKVIKQVKKLQKRGKNVHLITARDKFDNPEEFRRHFERHGIKLKPGNIHYTGGMKGGDVGQKKVAVAKGISKMSGSKGIHMYDDAAKVHKAFEAEKKKSPNLRIKTHLAKPDKKGEVVTRSYQAVKEDFQLWMNNLLDEGYDLSSLTLEELCYIYADELLEEYGSLDEAVTAIGAPAPGDKRPEKKFIGPYSKKIKDPYPKKKFVKEEELTPYEFWKSFIEEDVEEEIDDTDEELDIEERSLTSYEYWKSIIGEQAGSEDRGERHIAHDMATKNRDANQKVTIVSTASRPGNTPSLKLPISSVPHVHTPKSKA